MNEQLWLLHSASRCDPFNFYGLSQHREKHTICFWGWTSTAQLGGCNSCDLSNGPFSGADGGDGLHLLKVYFLCRWSFQAVSKQICTGNKLRILWTLCAMNLRSSKKHCGLWQSVPLWWRTGLIFFVSWHWIMANAYEAVCCSILLLFGTAVYLVYFTMNAVSVYSCGLTGE
jgi:hypothetical protein